MIDAAPALIVGRLIAASPERVFRAWTEPDELQRWWGPAHVTPTDVEMDLRVGGAYRIGNRLADGNIIWISGVFEVIEAPHLLRYTWSIGTDRANSVVTVRFLRRGDATEVVITHERVASAEMRSDHEAGWNGCLDGLADMLASESR
jgi:uncharacterized protein YndB with AHSA1/START domain